MKAEINNIRNKHKAFLVTPWKDGIDWFEEARKILFLWLGVMAILGWLGKILSLSYSRAFVFGTALFLAAAFKLILQQINKSNRKIVYAAYGGIPVLLLLVPSVQTGISGLFHDAAKTLAKRGISLIFKGSYTDSTAGKTFAMILLACWLILLLNFCVERSRLPLCLIFLFMLLAEMFFGGGTTGIWLLIWVFWLGLLFVTSMRSYIFLFAPLLLFMCIFTLIFGVSSDSGWRSLWNQLRYRENTAVLPDGDLSKAGKMKRNDTTALTLDSDSTGYYYLKGFVGTVYDGNSWLDDSQTLDDFETGIVGGNNEFLTWFHQKGYSGITELSSRVGNSKSQYFRITNKKANRRYLYVPYELSTTAEQLEKEGTGVFSSGETLLAAGLFGRSSYRYKTKYSLADSELKVTASETEDTENAYNAYEEYVNRTCLILPIETKEALKDMLGGSNTVGVDDTLAVVKKVRRWLSNNVTYNENPGAVGEKEDFLQWFLDGNKEGYDVQYASLAVMLFRYYGIPSRYVEGYIVENSSVISQENAHAWPEIFVSGIGWIPVEVMADYQNRMPSYLEEDGGTIYSSDENIQMEEKESSAQQDQQESTSQQDPQNNKDSQIKNNSEEEGGSYIPLVLLILFIVALIVALIVLIVFRLKEFSFRRRATQSISPERCIMMWYQYCIWLIYELEEDNAEKTKMTIDNRMVSWERRWKKRHPEVDARTLRQVGMLRQKAVYRKQGIDWDETENAIMFFKDEYRYFFRQLSFGNKCRVRLGLRPAFLRRKSIF